MIDVRPARPEDVHGIAETHVRTWQGAYGHAFPAELLAGLSVDGHEEWWRGVVESGSEQVWVAEEDGEVIGFASAGPSRTEEDVAELYALYVRPEEWGGGAGTALMRTVI